MLRSLGVEGRGGREGGAPAAPPLYKFAIRVCRLVFAADLISFINRLPTARRPEVACIALPHDCEITKIRNLEISAMLKGGGCTFRSQF